MKLLDSYQPLTIPALGPQPVLYQISNFDWLGRTLPLETKLGLRYWQCLVWSVGERGEAGAGSHKGL